MDLRQLILVVLIIPVGCSVESGKNETNYRSQKPDSEDSEASTKSLSFSSPGESNDGEECTIEEANGILRQCCAAKRPYTGLRNCTDFAANFHGLCIAGNINCRSVDIVCQNPRRGHRVNIIEIENRGFCLIEPQDGIVYGCFPDPDEIPQHAICSIMHLPGDCDCKAVLNSQDILQPNTRTFECRQESETFGECTGCCGNHWWYKRCREMGVVPGCQAWLDGCLNECRGLPVR